MASTRRETTALKRSDALTIKSDGPAPLSSWSPGPLPFTIPRTGFQDAGSLGALIQNRLFPSIVHTVDMALDSHLRTGGSTVSIAEGSLVGRPLFAVSILEARAVELKHPPTWEQLFAFGILNADFLLRPEFALGTWFDESRDLHVCDVPIVVPYLHTALDLGKYFHQRSIYDLKKQQVILVSLRRWCCNISIKTTGQKQTLYI